MEPLSAILGFAGGLLNWDTARQRIDVARQGLEVERQRIESDLRLGIATLDAQERLAQIQASLAQLQALEQGQTDQTRSFYVFAKWRALSGALVAIAGVALLAGAFYLAQRQA
ncbi:MAG: hypothetical protein K6T57_12295 [Thermaceae bacterium]|nr:hypothetical protein [Thermaceae bacterium]